MPTFSDSAAGSPTALGETLHGWPTVRLQNRDLNLTLLPHLGGTIVGLRLQERPELNLIGQTPWGLRPFGQVRAPASPSATAMESWPGGWRTLFPNSGRASVTGGVELGESGEACLAHYEAEATEASVTLTARLVRMPFQVSRTISLHDRTVQVSETIRSLAGEELSTMWASQLMFTPPVLSARATIDCNAAIVRSDSDVVTSVGSNDLMPWPRAHGHSGPINLRSLPGAGKSETRRCYLSEFGSSQPSVSVTNADLGLKLTMSWDGTIWPYLWYEVEAGRQSGFPWYRKGYALMLAAASSWPARGIHEAERMGGLVSFAPDQERTAALELRIDSN